MDGQAEGYESSVWRKELQLLAVSGLWQQQEIVADVQYCIRRRQYKRDRWTVSRRLRHFFQEKLDSVPLVHSVCATIRRPAPVDADARWTAVVTTDEGHKLIGTALCKTCQLDPAPTWLVKDMHGLLSPFIALLFNKSLATGCFPSVYKNAVVRPLLKNVELDDSQLKNYRQLSNLPFLSQVVGQSRSEPAAVFSGQQWSDAMVTVSVLPVS